MVYDEQKDDAYRRGNDGEYNDDHTIGANEVAEPEQGKIWSAEFLGCGLSSCLFYMSQYILIAGLPLIITGVYGGTAFQAGMAMTYFQIGTILCRPFAGEIIDGFDKRKVLFSTTGIFLLIMIAFNFTTSMDLIFFLRLLHGMIFAIGTTAVAAVAVLVLPKHRKGEGIGYFSVFVNVAMVIGPFLGLTIPWRCRNWLKSDHGILIVSLNVLPCHGLLSVFLSVLPIPVYWSLYRL